MSVPLTPTGFVTPYGPVSLDEAAAAMNEDGMRGDLHYVPGHAEQVRAFETALGKRNLGDRQVVLPEVAANVRWARRASGKTGMPDTRRLTELRNLGYRMVKKTDIGQPWLTAMPPGAFESKDGTIVKDDLALMVLDGPKAASREAAKQAKWLAMSSARQEQALMDAAGKAKVAASVTKE